MLLLIAGTLIHNVSTILSHSPFHPSLIAKHRSRLYRFRITHLYILSHQTTGRGFQRHCTSIGRDDIHAHRQSKTRLLQQTSTKLPSCRGLVGIAALRAQVPRPSTRTANRLRHLHPHHDSLPSASLCETVVPRYQSSSARPLETSLKPT